MAGRSIPHARQFRVFMVLSFREVSGLEKFRPGCGVTVFATSLTELTEKSGQGG
jgi:hypothetical protein